MATKKAAEKDTVKATYEVISPLDHDGDHYDVGDTVELTAEQAKPLLGNTVKAPAKPAA